MGQSDNLKVKNIILTGMCGVGKSTVGVLLAKALGWCFFDTDVYVQVQEGRGLQEIIDEEWLKSFCEIEEKHILSIDVENTVVATGGSAIYSEKAMKHLGTGGFVVHIDLDYDAIEKRVTDLYTRGVVMEKGQTLRSLYEERQRLYRKYAQVRIDCSGKTQEDIAAEIAEHLRLARIPPSADKQQKSIRLR